MSVATALQVVCFLRDQRALRGSSQCFTNRKRLREGRWTLGTRSRARR
jgi:hypothetical protein